MDLSDHVKLFASITHIKRQNFIVIVSDGKAH